MPTARLAALATVACLCAPALAAPAPTVPIDPATIVVPDLTFKATPRDIDHYWEYFYFQKPGVTYAKALADLSECTYYSRFLQATGPIPDFVPLGGKSREMTEGMTNAFFQFGLVGGLMYSWIGDSINHGAERGNTRRCMGFKGYHRYGLSKALWTTLNKGTEQEIKARFAVIASGPAPTSEALEP